MRSLLKCAALSAIVGGAAIASAQTARPLDFIPYGMTIRGGVAVPLDSSLTNLDNVLINIGLEYQLPQSLFRSGESYFSLDFWTASLDFTKGSIFPLMINHREYMTGDIWGQRTYWFAGAGVAFIDVVSSTTAVAARLGVGKELGERIIFEGAVTITDRQSGVRANALTFNLGYRF